MHHRRVMVSDKELPRIVTDPIISGAFAFFNPGEFSTIDKAMNLPGADGLLHFAGEALSTHQAWVVGALNSAWRAVQEILVTTPEWSDKVDEFFKRWGISQEWIDPKASHDTLPQNGINQKYNMFLKLLVVHRPELFES